MRIRTKTQIQQCDRNGSIWHVRVKIDGKHAGTYSPGGPPTPEQLRDIREDARRKWLRDHPTP